MACAGGDSSGGESPTRQQVQSLMDSIKRLERWAQDFEGRFRAADRLAIEEVVPQYIDASSSPRAREMDRRAEGTCLPGWWPASQKRLQRTLHDQEVRLEEQIREQLRKHFTQLTEKVHKGQNYSCTFEVGMKARLDELYQEIRSSKQSNSALANQMLAADQEIKQLKESFVKVSFELKANKEEQKNIKETLEAEQQKIQSNLEEARQEHANLQEVRLQQGNMKVELQEVRLQNDKMMKQSKAEQDKIRERLEEDQAKIKEMIKEEQNQIRRQLEDVLERIEGNFERKQDEIRNKFGEQQDQMKNQLEELPKMQARLQRLLDDSKEHVTKTDLRLLQKDMEDIEARISEQKQDLDFCLDRQLPNIADRPSSDDTAVLESLEAIKKEHAEMKQSLEELPQMRNSLQSVVDGNKETISMKQALQDLKAKIQGIEAKNSQALSEVKTQFEDKLKKLKASANSPKPSTSGQPEATGGKPRIPEAQSPGSPSNPTGLLGTHRGPFDPAPPGTFSFPEAEQKHLKILDELRDLRRDISSTPETRKKLLNSIWIRVHPDKVTDEEEKAIRRELWDWWALWKGDADDEHSNQNWYVRPSSSK